MNRARAGLVPTGDCPTIAGEFELSDFMRAERIIDIHRDRHLDRFSVTLADFTMGIGNSVGEALADAQRRAA